MAVTRAFWKLEIRYSPLMFSRGSYPIVTIFEINKKYNDFLYEASSATTTSKCNMANVGGGGGDQGTVRTVQLSGRGAIATKSTREHSVASKNLNKLIITGK